MTWIVTDSAADLTPQDVATWGIHIVSQYIQFPEGEITNEQITPDDFYARLKAMHPNTPKTAQPSPADFLRVYKAAAEKGERVLSIHVSSGLSGTLNSARVAAQEMPAGTVTLIDTFSLSPVERFQVLAAAMAVKAGWNDDQIRERLGQIRDQAEIVYSLETLEYLARGGRIGRVQALAGALLQVKPVIHVDHKDGKYSTLGRGRTMSQTIKFMANHFKTMYGDKPVWVTALHAQLADKADEMEAVLKAELNVGRFDKARISPVLGVHTGPGLVGAGVVPLALFDGLT